MRFRAKFGALDWCTVGLALIACVLWLRGFHSLTMKFEVLAFPLLALQRIFNHLFVYWDVDSGSLRERRFWHTKQIVWSEVARVGSWTQPPNCVTVDYCGHGALPNHRETIVANPKDRTQFITALRRFAPHADFEA